MMFVKNKSLQEQFDAAEHFIEKFESCLQELDDDIIFREKPEKMITQGVGIIPEIMPAVENFFQDGYEVFFYRRKIDGPN